MSHKQVKSDCFEDGNSSEDEVGMSLSDIAPYRKSVPPSEAGREKKKFQEPDLDVLTPYKIGKSNESHFVSELLSLGIKPSELTRYYQAIKILNDLKSGPNGEEIYKLVCSLDDSDVAMYAHNYKKGVLLPTVEEALTIFRGGLVSDNYKFADGFLILPFMCRDRAYQLNICVEEKYGTYVSIPGDIDELHRAAHKVRNVVRSDNAVAISMLIGKSKKGREKQLCPPVIDSNREFKADLGSVAKRILRRFENMVLTFDDYKRIINDCLVAMRIEPYPNPGAAPGFKNSQGKYDAGVAREFVRATLTCTYRTAEIIPIHQFADYMHDNLCDPGSDFFVREVGKALRKHTIMDDYHFKDSTLISVCDGKAVKAQQVSIKHSKIADYLCKHLNSKYEYGKRSVVRIDYYGLGTKADKKDSLYDVNYGVQTFLHVMHSHGYTNVKLNNNRGPDHIILGDQKYPVNICDLADYAPQEGGVLVSDVMFSDPSNKYALTNSVHVDLMVECLKVGAICIVKLIRNLLKFDCEWVACGRNHNAEGFGTNIGLKLKGNNITGLKKKVIPEKYYIPHQPGNLMDVTIFYRNKFVVKEEEVSYQITRTGAVHGGVVRLTGSDGEQVMLDQKRVEKAMKASKNFMSAGILIVDGVPVPVKENKDILLQFDDKLDFSMVKSRKVTINFDE